LRNEKSWIVDRATAKPKGNTMNLDIIEAPWSDEQVRSLNRYQHADPTRAFVCPIEHDGDRLLFATKYGWVCRGCDYVKLWALRYMTRWSQ
jgi:hypothetical protein